MSQKSKYTEETKLAHAIQSYSDYIASQVLAKSITSVTSFTTAHVEECDIDGEKVQFGLSKVA